MRTQLTYVLLLLLFPALLSAQEKIPLRGSRDGPMKVEDVLDMASQIIGQRIIIDPALQGVSLQMLDDGSVTMDELRAILSMHDIELVYQLVDGQTVIKAYLQRNLTNREIGKVTRFFSAGAALPANNEIVTSVVEVRVANVEQVFAQVRALMSRDRDRLGNILFARGSTRLIITDKASHVAFYKQVIEALDQLPTALSMRVVALQHAEVSETASLLRAMLNSRTVLQNERGVGTTPQPQLLADTRTNQLVILAMADDLPALNEILAKLDIEVPSPDRYVVRLKHASAADLCNELNELYVYAATRVVASRRTNSLLIEASPAAIEEIRELLEVLDAAVD